MLKGWQWIAGVSNSTRVAAKFKAQKNRKPLKGAALMLFFSLRETWFWWSRGELNPRPSVRRLVLYMLRFRQLI